MDQPDYSDRLAEMAPRTLLPLLSQREKGFILDLAEQYRFTFQELRQVAQACRDLEMWRERSLSDWWPKAELATTGVGRPRKKKLLVALRSHLDELTSTPKTYPDEGPGRIARRARRLIERDTDRKLLGPCPAYSEQTVCCGLHTLDAVRGCPFSCSYCTIQTFYGDAAEVESNLAEKLEKIVLDPARRYHIGTGQASDSLVWGNRSGLLDALLDFANRNPNVLLELKSKSDRVDALTTRVVPPNVVCSWTLNTDSVILHEEAGTAPLKKRIKAARRLADRGVALGFHFHPMVHYRGWDEDYLELAETLQQLFAAQEVSFVSMGTVTLIKPVIREIRRRGDDTRILQMPLVSDHHGKLTYPDGVKIELFSTLYESFASWSEDVLFYLCMESAAIWRSSLGFAYPTNADFEADFLDHCLPGSSTGAGVARS